MFIKIYPRLYYLSYFKCSFPVSNNWNKIGKIFITSKTSNGFYQILDHKLKSKFLVAGIPRRANGVLKRHQRETRLSRPADDVKSSGSREIKSPEAMFPSEGSPFRGSRGPWLKLLPYPKSTRRTNKG